MSKMDYNMTIEFYLFRARTVNWGAITKVAGNTVEGVKFTYFKKVHFILAAEWH